MSIMLKNALTANVVMGKIAASLIVGSFLLILLYPAANNHALAQIAPVYSPISIQTDKQSYVSGETITISGNISPGELRAGEQLLIQVFNPKGTAYKFDMLNVTADGSFTYGFKVGGKNGITGEYTVKAFYRGFESETFFAFTSTETPGGVWRWFTVDVVGGTDYQIQYQITGGTLRSIVADVDGTSLIATIASSADGTLQLYFPRNLLDSWRGYSDEEYVVLVDGEDVTIEIEKILCEKKVTVPFEAGAETVEFIGTYLIGGTLYPEQNPLAPKGYAIEALIEAEGQEFTLPIVSNADYCSFSLDQKEKRLHAEIQGPQLRQGYFQITLPHRFLGGSYTVLVNDNTITDYNMTYNRASEQAEDSTTISLEYDGSSTRSIDIIGTTVIPEFTSFSPVVMLAAMVAAAVVIKVIGKHRLNFR